MGEEEITMEKEIVDKSYYEKAKKKFQSIKIRESSRKSVFLSMFLLTIFFASIKIIAKI